MECLICGGSHLEKLEKPKYGLLVTGNRNVFGESKGIQKCICADCGHIQYVQDIIYKETVKKIFRDYGTLHNKSFEDGKTILREHVVIEKVINTLQLPKKGNFLDIGCGSGEAMLFFHSKLPDWKIYGMDIGERFKEQVTIRTGGQYYSSLSEVCDSGKKYDLITINYVLSVADNPGEILDCVRSVLSEKGVLFIIDTDFEVQPYVLNVVETSSFLTKNSLRNILVGKGYKEFLTEFVHEKKEIWAFSMINEQKSQMEQNLYEENREIYTRKVGYLNNVIDIVEDCCRSNDKFAIWGMSNAGIWIAEIMKKLDGTDKQVVWIEEDEDILQKGYGVYGYPISRIDMIDFDTVVFLPFPLYVAQNIMKRYSALSDKIKFICFE